MEKMRKEKNAKANLPMKEELAWLLKTWNSKVEGLNAGIGRRERQEWEAAMLKMKINQGIRDADMLLDSMYQQSKISSLTYEELKLDLEAIEFRYRNPDKVIA
jgi:hypothetical protein